MKNFKLYFLVFMFSFLFLFSSVKAENITVSYDDFSYVSSSSFDSLLSSANNLGVPYFIWKATNNNYFLSTLPVNATLNLSRSFASLYLVVNNNYSDYLITDYVIGNSSYGSGYYANFELSSSWRPNNPTLIYSSLPLTVSGDFPIDITDGTNSVTCNPGEACPYFTEYSFYKQFIDVDDTPLLTSFISLTIDKLSYVCDFLTSDYIYLSIFVIFILYFVILMFRRLT